MTQFKSSKSTNFTVSGLERFLVKTQVTQSTSFSHVDAAPKQTFTFNFFGYFAIGLLIDFKHIKII